MAKDKLNYEVVLSEGALNRIQSYKQRLADPQFISVGGVECGQYLIDQISRLDPAVDNISISDFAKRVEKMSDEQFINCIMRTKQPKIFAESEVRGNGQDWVQEELDILGDIAVTVKATVYDNGVWPNGKDTKGNYTYPKTYHKHENPFEAELIFTPGPMLVEGQSGHGIKGDRTEVMPGGKFNQENYNKMIERRMLAGLIKANASGSPDQPIVVTMPGIGCGAFAGSEKGKMGERLDIAMQAMLEKHADKLPNVACIHYDSFAECSNISKSFGANGKLKYRVRPSTKGNQTKTQLSHPSELAENPDEFKNAKLVKVVAWDQVSFITNDFMVNSKNTDDGIVGGGTDVISKLMKKEGRWNEDNGTYDPPLGYNSWEQYAKKNGIHMEARGNVKVLGEDGKLRGLDQHLAQDIAKQQAQDKGQIQKNQKQDLAVGQPGRAGKKLSVKDNISQDKHKSENDILIFTSKDTKNLQVGIQFNTQEARDRFVNKFVATHPNVKGLREMFKVPNDLNTPLFIKPSVNKGLGVYVAKNGELAINLGDFETANSLQVSLGMRQGLSNTYRGQGAIYFDPDRLKAQPGLAIRGEVYDQHLASAWVKGVKPNRARYANRPARTASAPAAPKPQVAAKPEAVNKASSEVRVSAEGGTKDPQVKIQFASKAEREKFFDNFDKENAKDNVNAMFALKKDEKDPSVLYINSSAKSGGAGAYVAKNGELAINLGSDKANNMIREQLGVSKQHAFQKDKSSAIYFNKDVLPPAAKGSEKFIEGRLDIKPSKAPPPMHKQSAAARRQRLQKKPIRSQTAGPAGQKKVEPIGVKAVKGVATTIGDMRKKMAQNRTDSAARKRYTPGKKKSSGWGQGK